MAKKKELPFMSITAFCERMDCSYGMWATLVRLGDTPPYYKLGRTTRIPVASFEQWLQAKVIHPKIDV